MSSNRTTTDLRDPHTGRWGRFATTRAQRGDEGVTLVEILVVMFLAVIVAGIGGSILHAMTRGTSSYEDRVDVVTDVQDANVTLNRDVDDAINLRRATAQELELVVVRDGKCNVRHYLADPNTGTLSVTTQFYEQRSCRGPSSERTQDLVKARFTSTTTFTYWGEATIPIPTPVQDLRNVRAIEWHLAAEPYDDKTAPTYELSSSAVYTGLGESAGDGTPRLQAQRPLLTLTTPLPGRDAPVLAWTDPTPELTAYYVIRRSEGPEGRPADPAFTVFTTPDASMTTWTDLTLPAGHAARYWVVAMLRDGAPGPASNAVDAGLRPSTPTGVTATGQPASIAVSWTAVSGATGYDVYRDGALAGQVATCPRDPHSLDGSVCTTPPATSWTDETGAGHSHVYQVVATSRWEALVSTGNAASRVPVGTPVTAPGAGGTTRLASAVTAGSGAFTAPAAPGLGVTPRADWSNYLARSFAPWVGSGPTSKGGQHRDRTIEIQTATLTGPYQPLWTWSGSTPNGVHADRPAGATTRYEARACNAVGCSDWVEKSALQRPPAALSCSTGAPTTRSLQVVVNPAVMESTATGYEVTGGTGTPIGGGVRASGVFDIDQLTHATSHGFTARVRNGSPANGGWSDPVNCAGATLVLTAPAPTCSVTVHDSQDPGSITISGGQQVRLGSGGTWYGSPQRYNGLGDGWYTGWALNTASDGYNSVSATDACPARQVTPFVPSNWSGTAPDCPGPAGWYISPTSTWGWQVRRATKTTCELRTTVTRYGADILEVPEGTQLSLYRYVIGSGSATWTQLSGEPRSAYVFWP